MRRARPPSGVPFDDIPFDERSEDRIAGVILRGLFQRGAWGAHEEAPLAAFPARRWPASGRETDENGSRACGNHHLTARRGGRRTSSCHSRAPRGGRDPGLGQRRSSRMVFRRWKARRASSIGPEPENEARRSATGDRHAAHEGAFRARRWSTSRESEKGSLLESGIYQGALRGEKNGP
jgi:hypothetical protein